MMTDPILCLISFIAAFLAGCINAIAGGGTLLSFPMLIAFGLPPVTANISNTIALCPGYFGGIWAQRSDLAAHQKKLYAILPVSILGGIIGGLLLIHSDEKSFEQLIPYLILIASLILAVQVPLKKFLLHRSGNCCSKRSVFIVIFISLFLASIYGGYFGAGVSVIVLALLGLMYDDSITSLNVLKLVISFSINVTAALYFACTGRVEWLIVLIMCCGSIIGGFCGGRVAGMIPPDLLRWMVVSIGLIVAGIFFS